MLINLSNHPFDKWTANQKSTALRLYGEVKDLDFPYIDPSWSLDQVHQLAEEYLSKIKLLPPATVHLMGELTFCFTLASLLKAQGIPCVASTTNRMVEEVDGKKLSTFKFVQFRPYF